MATKINSTEYLYLHPCLIGLGQIKT